MAASADGAADADSPETVGPEAVDPETVGTETVGTETEGTGRLRLVRDSGYYQDVLRSYRVEIDGGEVARLRPGESVEVEVEPGLRVVRARIDWTVSVPVSVQVRAGEVRTVVVRPGSMFRIFSRVGYLEVVPPAARP